MDELQKVNINEDISTYLKILAEAVLKGQTDVVLQGIDNNDDNTVDITFGVKININTNDYNNITITE